MRRTLAASFVLVLAACASTPPQEAAPPPDERASRPTVVPEIALCEGGDQKACAELGLRYSRGDGVPLDAQRASQLLERACDANVARGCGYLAGRLVAERQYERAFTLAERSCTGGAGIGCYHLAEQYERGLGTTTRNLKRALELHEQACKDDVLQSCTSAASLHERGAAGTIDEAAAARLYGRACQGGIPVACPAELRLVAFRNGAPNDTTRALPLATAACTAGTTHACGTTALIALMSRPNDAQALQQLERACSDHHHAFCIALASFVERGLAQGDALRAKTLLRTACDGGWKQGCDRLVAP